MSEETCDLFDVIRAQRACRAFTDAPVADADLARILDAAIHAPSAENKQPWEFVVVRDPGSRAAIGALIARAWNTVGRDFSRDRLSAGLLADVEHGATGGIADAPVHIVVGADTERGLPMTVAESIFPAVQNLMLAAGAELNQKIGSAGEQIGAGMAGQLGQGIGKRGGGLIVEPLHEKVTPWAPGGRFMAENRTLETIAKFGRSVARFTVAKLMPCADGFYQFY